MNDDKHRKIEGFFEGTTPAPQFVQSVIQLGDTVRVKRTPETERLDLAGLTGPVFGQTIPSTSAVDVVGTPKNDYAINVYFEERDQQFWFADDLLELVDKSPD
jgi:hypothetical protein